MPQGMATAITSSRVSWLPPRARQRRPAMIMPTMIPAMMHSAYARSGKPNTSHTPLAGLGMKRGVKTFRLLMAGPLPRSSW